MLKGFFGEGEDLIVAHFLAKCDAQVACDNFSAVFEQEVDEVAHACSDEAEQLDRGEFAGEFKDSVDRVN